MTESQIAIATLLVCCLILPVLIAAGTRNIGRRPKRQRWYDDQNFG